MTSDTRPDPLGALRAAAVECEVTLPEGILEEILQLESDLSQDQVARSRIRASLKLLIEKRAASSG